MLKNYLTIVFRQLNKQKMYAAVKIGGFALSIAACLLIGLYIKDELSYDKNYQNGDRIFRLVENYSGDGLNVYSDDYQAPFAKAIKADFPDIEKSARIMPNNLFYGAGSNELRRSDQIQNTHEEGFTYADQNLLDILHTPMVYGNREHALTNPNTMVISKRKSDKYFPNQNPVGRTMYLNNDLKKPYKIGGVMENPASNSHLQYDFLLTLKGIEFYKGEQSNWNANNYPTYILVKPGTNLIELGKKITEDYKKNYVFPTLMKGGVKDPESQLSKLSEILQPVSDIHIESKVNDEFQHGDIRFVWLFAAAAAFILIIASINFINLSTAKSANRAKEVGLRKTVGSTRQNLINQFLAESFLYSLLSFIAGILLAWVLLPYFNLLASKTLSMPWNSLWFFLLMLIASILVGIAAGIYPAFYLSSFQPASVLKGSISTGSKNSFLRNGLVVFQFSASIILIISTLVINNQMHFILNRDLGFNKDQVVMLQGTNTIDINGIKTLKDQLLRLSAVKSVSVSDYLPVADTKRNENTLFNSGRVSVEHGVDTQFWQIDQDYLKTFGIKLAAGSNFIPGVHTDTAGIIVNQNLVKQLNLKEPIGKLISNGWGGTFRVIGVVKDFNFDSMRGSIGALCMIYGGKTSSIVSVKIAGGDPTHTLSSISSIWKSISPSQSIRYSFLDERFAHMYADVQRMGNIFTTFGLLAIAIACLGLFALATFIAEQRSKEIGIRKVLGASVQGITTMLSYDFLKLVILSIVIASPVAWYVMNSWLENFAYRTTISWWIFAVAGMIAILIALGTVSYQSIKAALMNPVKSLRAE